jgi:threonine/homoserine/homoserine lactone efflux protein
MGAATADCFYGLVAGLGLASISALLIEQQRWIRLFGGVFLLYLGGRIFFSRPSHGAKSGDGGSLGGAYLSSLALTITNPMTILSFAAAFAGLGLGVSSGSNLLQGFVMVCGVFLGSAAWWLVLSGGVGLLQKRVSDSFLLWINRVSGAIILGFGALAIIWAYWSK